MTVGQEIVLSWPFMALTCVVIVPLLFEHRYWLALLVVVGTGVARLLAIQS